MIPTKTSVQFYNFEHLFFGIISVIDQRYVYQYCLKGNNTLANGIAIGVKMKY